jgi:osmotically-inducible protein OsmY
LLTEAASLNEGRRKEAAMNRQERRNGRLHGWLAALALIGIVSWGCSHSSSASQESRTAGSAIRDASITASVKISLVFEPGVAATEINVDTDHGVVTLRGEVGTEAERQLAVKVAEDVSNVREVVNELKVRG